MIGVTMSVPSTLAKRSTETTVAGLSSAKSRTSASASTSERSMRVRGEPERGVSSAKVLGSLLGRAVDQGGGLHHDLVHRASRALPPPASRFIVPITLISWRVREENSVESTTKKVCTMVSTWVACTMRLRME